MVNHWQVCACIPVLPKTVQQILQEEGVRFKRGNVPLLDTRYHIEECRFRGFERHCVQDGCAPAVFDTAVGRVHRTDNQNDITRRDRERVDMTSLGGDGGDERSMRFLFRDRKEVVLSADQSMFHRKVDELFGYRIKVAMRRSLRSLEQRVDFIPCKDTACFQRIGV